MIVCKTCLEEKEDKAFATQKKAGKCYKRGSCIHCEYTKNLARKGKQRVPGYGTLVTAEYVKLHSRKRVEKNKTPEQLAKLELRRARSLPRGSVSTAELLAKRFFTKHRGKTAEELLVVLLKAFYVKNPPTATKLCNRCWVSQPLDCFKTELTTASNTTIRNQCLTCLNTSNRPSKAKYKKENPERCALGASKRRSNKLNRTPKWLSQEMHDIMLELYKARTPEQHVDHIVPLVGRTVSGLHVPWNLRVISAHENTTKSNKLVEELAIQQYE